MTHLRSFAVILGVACIAGGCQSTQTASHRSASEEHLASSPSAAAATPAGQADPQIPTGLSYRAQQLKDAMRGLNYDNESVTIDGAVAATIAQPGSRQQAEAALADGMVSLDANEQHGAIRGFTRAVITDPTFAEAYKQLGVALSQRGKEKEALSAFRKTIELAPADVDARTKLAWSLGRLARWDEERAAWRTVIGMEPNHAEAHGRLAIALYMNEELDAALAEIRVAETLGYEFPAQFLDQIGSETN